MHRGREVAVVLAVDGRGCRRWGGRARGSCASSWTCPPVGAEEAGDHARLDREAQVLDCDALPVVLRQAAELDHSGGTLGPAANRQFNLKQANVGVCQAWRGKGRARSASLAWSTPPGSQAGDGSRTRDLWLGKPTLYQLSYTRVAPILRGCGWSPRKHIGWGDAHGIGPNARRVEDAGDCGGRPSYPVTAMRRILLPAVITVVVVALLAVLAFGVSSSRTEQRTGREGLARAEAGGPQREHAAAADERWPEGRWWQDGGRWWQDGGRWWQDGGRRQDGDAQGLPRQGRDGQRVRRLVRGLSERGSRCSNTRSQTRAAGAGRARG